MLKSELTLASAPELLQQMLSDLELELIKSLIMVEIKMALPDSRAEVVFI